eukprot:g28184.t1
MYQDTIDDAKKRAITTTASYDEFKSRVAGCMLKPIHKNEFNAPPKFSYNRQVEKSRGAYPPSTLAERVNRSDEKREIRSIRELDKELRRRQTAEERAELVVHMNSEAVQRIFGREMDAEVFQKLLEALEQAAHVPAGTARRFLTDMATCCPSSTSQATAFYSAEDWLKWMIPRWCVSVPAGVSHLQASVRRSLSVTVATPHVKVRLPAETGIQNAWAKMTDCGFAYLLQLIVEVFGDAFHLHTLEKVLATCAEVHWSVDLKPLTQHLLSRLTSFLADMGRMGEEVKGKSALDVFGLFHSHMKQLHSRPRTAATPLDSLLELQLDCWGMGHHGTFVNLLDRSRQRVEVLGALHVRAGIEHRYRVLHGTSAEHCAAARSSWCAMPIGNQAGPVSERRSSQVSALLAGDVRLQDSETVQNLFLLTGPLLRDKTGKDDPGEDLMRHLEHDPLVFRTEQETMAQLIHQVRQDDPKVVFEMLSILWKHFEQARYNLPLVRLTLPWHSGIWRAGHTESSSPSLPWSLLCWNWPEEPEAGTGCGRSRSLISRTPFAPVLEHWLHGSGMKQGAESNRYNAAAAEKQEATRTELVQRISSSMDNALLCLERNISEQEARLRGLQLLVGTLRQMRQGMEEGDLKKVCDRAVALANKMLSKRFQSMAFCLCCEMFWLPRLNFQEMLGLDPLDVGLFVDILDQVIRLFAEGASQVSAAILSKILALCVQHIQYIGNRVPVESMRALRTVSGSDRRMAGVENADGPNEAIVGLAAKQNESMEEDVTIWL